MRQIVSEHRIANAGTLRVVQGDITLEEVDAIVNAANGRLVHGGGVAGAIVRRGGKAIQSESNAWVLKHGLVPTGRAAITGGGDLKAKFVIHAVGPVWGTSDEEAKLAQAVHSALDIAARHDVRSISVPAISSGIFGFPRVLCAQVIVDAVKGYLLDNPEASVEEVNLVLFDDAMAELFDDMVSRRLGPDADQAFGEQSGMWSEP